MSQFGLTVMATLLRALVMTQFFKTLEAAVPALLIVAAASMMSQAVAADSMTIAESREGAALIGDRPVSVTLAPTSPVSPGGLLRALPPDERLYLTIEKLHAEGPVEATYEVYLDLPAGAAPNRSSPNYVGDFNFFDAESGRRNVSFNITKLMMTLRSTAALSDSPKVTIVPNGQAAPDAQPNIGRVAIVAASR
ncbi:MAG TPA: hypothetical protein VIJ78_00420 [Pseudolabrys sp.]